MFNNIVEVDSLTVRAGRLRPLCAEVQLVQAVGGNRALEAPLISLLPLFTAMRRGHGSSKVRPTYSDASKCY